MTLSPFHSHKARSHQTYGAFRAFSSTRELARSLPQLCRFKLERSNQIGWEKLIFRWSGSRYSQHLEGMATPAWLTPTNAFFWVKCRPLPYRATSTLVALRQLPGRMLFVKESGGDLPQSQRIDGLQRYHMNSLGLVLRGPIWYLPLTTSWRSVG